MRISLSVPERAHGLWARIQAAAENEHTTISAWLLNAAAIKLGTGSRLSPADQTGTLQPGALSAQLDAFRQWMGEELVMIRGELAASCGSPRGSESGSPATNPEPAQPPAAAPPRQRGSRTRAGTQDPAEDLNAVIRSGGSITRNADGTLATKPGSHPCCKHCPPRPHPAHADPCRQGC